MARIVIRHNIAEGSNSSNKSWWSKQITIMIIISMYFVMSIGLTFYQGKFLKTHHFSLTVVFIHLVFKFIVALSCRKIFEWSQNQKRVSLCWHNQLYKMAPTGIASGLDIGFSNWGLQIIAVSLYTMTKSTSVVFILIFAIMFQLEKKSWFVFVVVCMISLGLVMFTYEATEFNWLGFSLVLFASFLSGIRWTLAQFVMQRSDLNMSSPVDMIYHVQPWMMMSILPFALVTEGPQWVHTWFEWTDSQWSDFGIGVLEGALLACLMEYAEYMVVSRTSGLTLSIVGIVKEIATLILAVESENQPLSLINVIGLVVCLTGVASHLVYKSYRQYRYNDSGMVPDSIAQKPLLDMSSARFLLSSSDEGEDEDDTEVLFNVLNSRDR